MTVRSAFSSVTFPSTEKKEFSVYASRYFVRNSRQKIGSLIVLPVNQSGHQGYLTIFFFSDFSFSSFTISVVCFSFSFMDFSCSFSVVVISDGVSDHTAGGHPAVLRSDHASRRHDAGRLYVNAQDSFSCTGSRGDKPYVLAFHQHHITWPSKSFSCFENFGKRCGVRLYWHFYDRLIF